AANTRLSAPTLASPSAGRGRPSAATELPERPVPVVVRLFRQAPHPFADDVALDLVAAPSDPAGRGRKERCRPASCFPVGPVPRYGVAAEQLSRHAGAEASKLRAGQLADGASRARTPAEPPLLRKPGAEEMHHALSYIQLREPLADDGVAVHAAGAAHLGQRAEGGASP